jgi:galactoside O-acetyltransferase
LRYPIEHVLKGELDASYTDVAKVIFCDMGDTPLEEVKREFAGECEELMTAFNGTLPSETEKRRQLARRMFKKTGGFFWIEPPIYVAYGSPISIGEHFYANCNLTIIDDWEVEIGDNVLFGPNIPISTTSHPLEPEKRREGTMYAFKVIVQDDVWAGGGAAIGAGSVVTKDIPANVIAAWQQPGNYRTK